MCVCMIIKIVNSVDASECAIDMCLKLTLNAIHPVIECKGLSTIPV